MTSCWTRLATALLLLVGPNAFSQEVAPWPLPALTGLTVIVNNRDPGFFVTGNSAPDRILQFEFFLFIEDLKVHYNDIASVRIETPVGEGWNIDKTKYFDLNNGYIGGYANWGLTGVAWSGQTLAPATFLARVGFADGRAVTQEFTIAPPRPRSSQGPLALFLVTQDFPGLLTPYHVVVPSAPQITAVNQVGEDVEVEFVNKDPLIDDGKVILYDSTGQVSWESPALKPVEGADPWPWVNDGRGLFADGRTNRVQVPRGLLKKFNGKAVTSVALLTEVSVDPRSNLLGVSSLYRQSSASYRFPGPPDGLQVASPPPSKPTIVPSAWRDSSEDELQWEIRLEGPIGALNRHEFRGLSPLSDTQANRDLTGASLRTSWSIVDRPSLIQNLERLRDAGHRKAFQEAQDLGGQPGDPQTLANQGKPQGPSAADILFARQFSPLLGDRGLLAWDLCRMVFLVRCGYFLGYLSEAEARGWLKTAGNLLRDHFHDWRELGEDYMVGRMFWGSLTQAQALYLEGHGALERLLEPGGAWYQAPWAPPTRAGIDFLPEIFEGPREEP